MSAKKTEYSVLIPGSKEAIDFAKIGLGLYIIGLIVMFAFLVQLNILSTDLIKPHAIIVGIYVWFLFDTAPRLVLYTLNKIKLRQVIYNLIFGTGLIVFYQVLIFYAEGFSLSGVFFGLVLAALVIIYFYQGKFDSKKIIPTDSAVKRYLLIIPFCLVFSISLFPAIPHYLGGGSPQKVKIYTDERQLFLSQFSTKEFDGDSLIEADLLYEAENAYYFIQAIGDDSIKMVFNNKIKKVNKTLIKKIEFTKAYWIKF